MILREKEGKDFVASCENFDILTADSAEFLEK